MFKSILKLIKHLEAQGDLTGVRLCYDIGDAFTKEFKAINKAFDRVLLKNK